MTREEKIEILEKEKAYMIGHGGDRQAKALDSAIKALKQESVLDKIRDEIKEWYWQADKQALAKDPCVVDAMIDLFVRTIDKYKVGEK